MTAPVKNNFDTTFANYHSSPIHAEGKTIAVVQDFFKDAKFERIADVGCGTGHAGLSLLQFTKQLSFIDPSYNMLQKIKESLNETDKNKVLFFHHSAESITVEEHGKYDLMISRMALHHFENVPQAIKAMCDCLKHEGILIISDLYRPKTPFLSETAHQIEVLHDATHGKCYTDLELIDIISQNCNTCEILKNEVLNESEQGISIDFWCSITNTPYEKTDTIKKTLALLNDDALSEMGYYRKASDSMLMNTVKTNLLILKILK